MPVLQLEPSMEPGGVTISRFKPRTMPGQGHASSSTFPVLIIVHFGYYKIVVINYSMQTTGLSKIRSKKGLSKISCHRAKEMKNKKIVHPQYFQISWHLKSTIWSTPQKQPGCQRNFAHPWHNNSLLAVYPNWQNLEIIEIDMPEMLPETSITFELSCSFFSRSPASRLHISIEIPRLWHCSRKQHRT